MAVCVLLVSFFAQKTTSYCFVSSKESGSVNADKNRVPWQPVSVRTSASSSAAMESALFIPSCPLSPRRP